VQSLCNFYGPSVFYYWFFSRHEDVGSCCCLWFGVPSVYKLFEMSKMGVGNDGFIWLKFHDRCLASMKKVLCDVLKVAA
jgi:hypothetical protein